MKLKTPSLTNNFTTIYPQGPPYAPTSSPLDYIQALHVVDAHGRSVAYQTIILTGPELGLFGKLVRILRHFFHLCEVELLLGQQVVNSFGILRGDVVNLRQVFLLRRWLARDVRPHLEQSNT